MAGVRMQSSATSALAKTMAVPSSRVITEASSETASANNIRSGNPHMMARNRSYGTPPIRNGRASIGKIASRFVNAIKAELRNLLANTSPAPNPLKNNSPSVWFRRSSASTPAVKIGARSTK
jgi:hypothetical protein